MCCLVLLSGLYIHIHVLLHRIVDTMWMVLHMGFDVLSYFRQYSYVSRGIFHGLENLFPMEDSP